MGACEIVGLTVSAGSCVSVSIIDGEQFCGPVLIDFFSLGFPCRCGCESLSVCLRNDMSDCMTSVCALVRVCRTVKNWLSE